MTNIIEPLDHRIAEIRDERDMGGSVNIYLKPGFRYGRHSLHCFPVLSPSEVGRAMRAVKPCKCEECAQQLKFSVASQP